MAEQPKSTEKVIYEGHPSWARYWHLIGMGGLLIAAGFQLVNSPGAEDSGYYLALPGILLLGLASFSVTATTYTVTARRVICKKGLFSPQISEMDVSAIEHVRVEQDTTERLLAIGKVTISTADPSETEVVFAGVSNPRRVAALIPGRRSKVAQRQISE